MSRPLARCFLSLIAAWIWPLPFSSQGSDLLFGLRQTTFQARLAPKRTRPRAGTHLHPILSDTLQLHQPGIHHRRQNVCQQLVQSLLVSNPRLPASSASLFTVPCSR